MEMILISRKAFDESINSAENLEVDTCQENQLKAYYKYVVNMLYLLQRHGIYAVFAFLAERNTGHMPFTIQTMRSLNRFILDSGLGSQIVSTWENQLSGSPDQIFARVENARQIQPMRQTYGRAFLNEDAVSDICSLFLKQYLTHFKLELNAAIKSRED